MMMYWGGGGWSWGIWVATAIAAVAFSAMVAAVVIVLVRRTGGYSQRPEDVLADRFARGEIEEDEFMRRREALRSVR